MKCRAVTGIAQFCGWPEYVPSVPPLYYRTKNMSGESVVSCSTDDRGCTNPNGCVQTWIYTGSSIYDKLTCARTDTGQLVNDAGCFGGIPVTIPVTETRSVDFDNIPGAGGNTFNYPDIFTSNSHSFGSPNAGVCRESGSGFRGCVDGFPTCESIISDQDTVEDAIFRQIGSDPHWSGPDNGNCMESTSFTTLWNSPTFGFSKAQVQVSIPFATSGHKYKIVIKLGERATGSSAPYVPFGEIDAMLEPTMTVPAVTDWLDIPIVDGIQVAATSCTITDVT